RRRGRRSRARAAAAGRDPPGVPGRPSLVARLVGHHAHDGVYAEPHVGETAQDQQDDEEDFHAAIVSPRLRPAPASRAAGPGEDGRMRVGPGTHGYRAPRTRRGNGQAPTVTVVSCTPGASWTTDASPVHAEDSARIVHSPGAAKKRKSPVAEATTSAVNSSVETSRRTNAPPTGWPSVPTTRPVRTVSVSASTPPGRVWLCVGAPHIVSFLPQLAVCAYAPCSMGAPTSEPYSTQLPS